MDQLLSPGDCYTGLRLNYASRAPVCGRLLFTDICCLSVWEDYASPPHWHRVNHNLHWLLKCKMPMFNTKRWHSCWTLELASLKPFCSFCQAEVFRVSVWFAVFPSPSATTSGNIPNRGFSVSLGSRIKMKLSRSIAHLDCTWSTSTTFVIISCWDLGVACYWT